MNLVIPMAGRGKRFVEAGYKVPKFLLEAHGKTLLEWSVNSLPLELADRTVFIMLSEHEKDFQVANRIRQLYSDRTKLEFVFLDQTTRGQAETVLCAASVIDPDSPLVIFNIDTMFKSPTLVNSLLDTDADGVLGYFHSSDPRFSFAETDRFGNVIRVSEKDPISQNALTGFYHFRFASDFIDVASRCINEKRLTKGEFYVAPLYNQLLLRGSRLILDHAPVHHILGTPEEYERFLLLDKACDFLH
jgi:dTDP-glucose pyrophosphorylase